MRTLNASPDASPMGSAGATCDEPSKLTHTAQSLGLNRKGSSRSEDIAQDGNLLGRNGGDARGLASGDEQEVTIACEGCGSFLKIAERKGNHFIVEQCPTCWNDAEADGIALGRDQVLYCDD